MSTLAIIHTTLATTISLPPLAAEILSGVTLRNFVDDTILPKLIENGGNLSEVEGRINQYAQFAEQSGADVILCACSSIGEIVPLAQQSLHIPFLRIDEPMAEEAVRIGKTIGVAATLETTLGPTSRLIQQKATESGKEIILLKNLVEGAYAKLTAGDSAGHDALLLENLDLLAAAADVVILAQASMARVLPQLPAAISARFLTSPRSGLEKVRTILKGLE
jgi:aspartate/glutamate racemase